MAEPIQLSRDDEAKVADQRTLFEQAVFRVQADVESEKIQSPDCFISYACGEPVHERWVEKRLALDLQKAGITVIFDRWENMRAGKSVARFVERIGKADRVITIGTPLYRHKYENKDTETGYVVAAEVDMINDRMLATEEQRESVLPIVLKGKKTEALPPLLRGRVHKDFSKGNNYFTAAFDLILDLYNTDHQNKAVADLREPLQGRF